jgi:DNA-binding response OmpR family regulator
MRALLVEDSVAVGEAVSSLLAPRLVVDHVTTIDAAYQQVDVNPYDVLVIDRNLPDGDGLKFCAQLRQEGCETPMLILTVRDQTSEIVEGLKSGVDEYMTKPFSHEELVARIEALLRRVHATYIPSVMKIGNCLIDQENRQVLCDEERVSLSPKEYQLVEILAWNHPRTVGFDALGDMLWPDGSWKMNTLAAVVNRARRKLKGKLEIGTRKLIGYQLTHTPT